MEVYMSADNNYPGFRAPVFLMPEDTDLETLDVFDLYASHYGHYVFANRSYWKNGVAGYTDPEYQSISACGTFSGREIRAYSAAIKISPNFKPEQNNPNAAIVQNFSKAIAVMSRPRFSAATGERLECGSVLDDEHRYKWKGHPHLVDFEFQYGIKLAPGDAVGHVVRNGGASYNTTIEVWALNKQNGDWDNDNDVVMLSAASGGSWSIPANDKLTELWALRVTTRASTASVIWVNMPTIAINKHQGTVLPVPEMPARLKAVIPAATLFESSNKYFPTRGSNSFMSFPVSVGVPVDDTLFIPTKDAANAEYMFTMPRTMQNAISLRTRVK